MSTRDRRTEGALRLFSNWSEPFWYMHSLHMFEPPRDQKAYLHNPHTRKSTRLRSRSRKRRWFSRSCANLCSRRGSTGALTLAGLRLVKRPLAETYHFVMPARLQVTAENDAPACDCDSCEFLPRPVLPRSGSCVASAILASCAALLE
jgi:hypothetical protein